MKLIYLAPGQARCTGEFCQRGKPCARKLAPHALGRPLADYSIPNGPGSPADCCVFTGWPKFISLDLAVEPATPKAPKDWIGQ